MGHGSIGSFFLLLGVGDGGLSVSSLALYSRGLDSLGSTLTATRSLDSRFTAEYTAPQAPAPIRAVSWIRSSSTLPILASGRNVDFQAFSPVSGNRRFLSPMLMVLVAVLCYFVVRRCLFGCHLFGLQYSDCCDLSSYVLFRL